METARRSLGGDEAVRQGPTCRVALSLGYNGAMNARRIPLLRALSFTLGTVSLVGCGGGEFYPVAPGAEYEPPPPPTDAGNPDSGQPPADAGNGGCIVVQTAALTPEEDFEAFVETGVAGLFNVACASCHVGAGRSGSGTGLTWGIPPAAADKDRRPDWFEACSTLLSLPRNAGKPVEETTLYQAFSGVFEEQRNQHPRDESKQAAVAAWVSARAASTEIICDEPGNPDPDPEPGVDAGQGSGPDPDPGPGGCSYPTKAESEARFLSLDVATHYAICRTCHAGGNHAHTKTGDDWGTPEGSIMINPSPTAWHNAVWDLTTPERGSATPQTSKLYRYLNGAGLHNSYESARDASLSWLEYVLDCQ